jgi:hypothetical protein
MGTLARALQPIAANLAGAPRVYVDANVPSGVVAALRAELGWDVLFVLEHDELRRARDAEHFRLAREFGRTLVTLDRDFLDPARFPPVEGPGVIVCTAPDEIRLLEVLRGAHRDGLLNTGPAPLAGRVIELVWSGRS